MPRVVGINGALLDVETDDGRRIPVARGTLPDLDAQALVYEQSTAPPQMGGASASAPIANLTAGPDASQAQPMSDVPGPAFAPMSGAALLRQADVPAEQSAQITRSQMSPEQQTELRQIDVTAQAQAQGLRPGTLFGGVGQTSGPTPSFQGQEGPRPTLQMVRGREGGGPRRTITTSQEIYGAPSNETSREVGDTVGELDVERAIGAEQAAMQFEREARRIDELRGELKARDTAAQQAARERQGRLDAARRSIAEASERATNFKVNPDRLFEEKGTGTRIVAAIAVALGQFGAALGGGSNAALQILDAQIDRDIDAQRAKGQALQSRVGHEQTLFGQLREQLGDESAAEHATKSALLERAALEAEQLGAAAASEQVRQNASTFAAEARAQSAQMRAAAEVAAQPVTRIETQARMGGGGGRPRLQVTDPATGLTAEIDAPRDITDLEKIREFVSGGGEDVELPRIPGLDISDPQAAAQLRPEDLSNMRQRAGEFDDLLGSIGRLREIAGDTSLAGRRLSPELRQEVGALRSNIQVGLGAMNQLGALAEADLEIINNQVPDINGLVGNVSRVDAVERTLRRKANARTRPFGFSLGGLRTQRRAER